MADYLDRLVADMKSAMKSGDRDRLEVIRMLISDIKKKAETAGGELTADDEAAVLTKAVKMRADTVAQATAGGRPEIAVKEQSEQDLIQSYLPRQLSAAEVTAKVAEIAAAIGYAGPKDTGRFMKEWMDKCKGLADGKTVQAALKALG